MKAKDLPRARILELDLRIQGLTKYDGECEVWIGYCRDGRSPIMHTRIDGRRSTVCAHHVRWIAKRHQALPDGIIRMACGNPLCMASSHMRALDRKEIFQENRDISRLKWRAMVSQGLRKSVGKLTDAQVREIRMSDAANTELAKVYGVSRSLVSGIKRGKFRRDLSEIMLGTA